MENSQAECEDAFIRRRIHKKLELGTPQKHVQFCEPSSQPNMEIEGLDEVHDIPVKKPPPRQVNFLEKGLKKTKTNAGKAGGNERPLSFSPALCRSNSEVPALFGQPDNFISQLAHNNAVLIGGNNTFMARTLNINNVPLKEIDVTEDVKPSRNMFGPSSFLSRLEADEVKETGCNWTDEPKAEKKPVNPALMKILQFDADVPPPAKFETPKKNGDGPSSPGGLLGFAETFGQISASRIKLRKGDSSPDQGCWAPLGKASSLDDPPTLERICSGRDSHGLSHDFIKQQVLSTSKWSSLRLGLNKTDGLLYAIKTYSKAYMELVSQEGFGTHFISRLSDENKYTVKYYNSWIEGNKFIIVREYCPISLRDIKNENVKINEKMIRKLIGNMCKGLTELHNTSIYHLNIKPDNILFSLSHKFKFSGAVLTKDYIKYIELMRRGVPGIDTRYAAPELLDKSVPLYVFQDSDALARADVFATGATLFEVLTGLDWSMHREKYLEKINNLLTVSESVKNIVKKMLERIPERRPSPSDILLKFLMKKRVEEELERERQIGTNLQCKCDEMAQSLNLVRKKSA